MLHKTIKIRNLSPSVYVLRLERKELAFEPGQCFNLGLKGSGVNREYSIYSGTSDPYLEFLIKEVKGGTVSTALRKVKPEDEINLYGPYGSFTITQDKAEDTVFTFISTGTGIAPFHSFVCTYPNLNYRIINGIRTITEQYDYNDYDQNRITTCISREDHQKGFKGRVTNYLQETNIDSTHTYLLCGNQNMIQQGYDLLRENGISGDHIFTEAFF